MPRADEIRLTLKPGREKSVRHGHPWLFSGAVARVDGSGGPAPGEEPAVARIFAADGRELGAGFYSARSQIRVRLAVAPGRSLDRAFFAERLAEAVALREGVLPPETTGYRLLNAEGDGVPGWIVDRFGDVLVSQITVRGLETLRAEAYAALAERFPEAAIRQLNDLSARRAERLNKEDETIAGEPPREAEFRERGLIFTADLAGGQKTGFYCDQRDNRARVEALAAGRGLLDLFANSGAFGIAARRGGARRVTHVESSPRMAEHGRRQYRLNGFDLDTAEWVQGNVFEVLREAGESYELVVCDPPPLARRKADLGRGSRAYKDINRLALGRLAPGGYFLTFSCSGAVDAKLFRQILFAAAGEAGVRLQLLAPLAAAPDHPVAITHPQGEYLKGWLCRRPGVGEGG